MTISNGSGKEGDQGAIGDISFTATLDKPSGRVIMATITPSTESGDSATTGTDFISRPVMVTFQKGDQEKSFVVKSIGDNEKEPDETFTITYSAEQASTPITTAKGTILSDDQPRVSIKVNNKPSDSIVEGMPFTVNLSTIEPTLPDSDNPIRVALNIDQGEEFIAFRVPRFIEMTSSMTEFKIHTLNNSVKNENGGTIRISISSYDESYTVDPKKSFIEVTIMKDPNVPTGPQPRISIADSVVETILNNSSLFDNSPEIANSSPIQIPQISINAVTNIVDEGAPVQFVISSNQILNSNLTINYTLSLEGEFFGNLDQEVQQMSLSKYQNTTLLEIPTIDDNLAEQDGAVTISLIDADAYTLSHLNQARVVISDLIDREKRVEELTHTTKSVLSDLTDVIGAHTFNIATDRMEQAFSNSNRTATFTFNGNQNLTSILTSSGEALNEDSITFRDMLGNSSFALSLSPENTESSFATIWGTGDNLDLTSETNLNSRIWDGDVFTGHLGIDTLIGQGFLTGISTSLTESEFEDSGSTEDSIQFKTRSTAFNPYMGWKSPDENTQLKAIAGFGVGELNIDQPNYELQNVTSTYHTVGVIGNSRIYYSESILNGGVSELTISGQSWLARQNLIGVDGLIDSLQSHARHYQIEVSGSHTQHLSDYSTLIPSYNFGLRSDIKDQQSIFGIELGSNLSYTSPLGFATSGTSNLFLNEQGDILKWSIFGSLNYDRGDDQLGTLFEISPSYGNIQDLKSSTIWDNNILNNVGETGHYEDGISIKSELAYGLNIIDETSILTPYGKIEFSEISTRQYNLGARIKIGPNLILELSGIRQANPTKVAEQSIQLDSGISW